MKKITAYKCLLCGYYTDNEYMVKLHDERHAKERLANKLLRQGKTLGEINNKCKFHWQLKDVHKTINKDSCFVISYLQCCEEPAYRICFISGGGAIRVWGIGGWSGGYSSFVGFHCLDNPLPLSELYVDSRA